MAEKVEISVIANDLASGALNLIKDKLSQIGGTTALVGTAMVTAGVAIVGALAASTDAAYKYDQQVKELMLRTGGTAEETSRLIQVVDDAGISYETLSTAMKFAVKNGIEPSIGSLAKLSDEYLQLAPGVDRGQFLLDKFGKSGMDMARAMDLGGAAILNMSKNVEAGLVLTDKAIQQSEEYRKNIDNLSDSWEALKVTIGNSVIPVLNDTITYTNNWAAAEAEVRAEYGLLSQQQERSLIQQKLANNAIYESQDILSQHADALNNTAAAEVAYAQSADEIAAAQKSADEATAAYTKTQQNLLNNALWLTSNQQTYNSSLDELNAKRLAEEAELALLTKRYGEHSQKVADQKKVLSDLGGSVDELKQKNKEQMNQWILSMMQQKGSTVEAQLAFAQAAGMIDEKSVGIINAVDKITDSWNKDRKMIMDTKGEVQSLMSRMIMMNGMEVTAYVNIVTKGSIPDFGTMAAAVSQHVSKPGAPAQSLAEGGIAHGPSTGYAATLHGNEAVIPLSGGRSVPVDMQGGGGNTIVNLTWAPMLSTMDRNQLQNELLPFIIQGIRQAKQR